MRISTQIIRTPFGLSPTAVTAQMYGASILDGEKESALDRHRRSVDLYTGDSRFLALASGYDETKNPEGGIDAEWWTVVVLDLDRP